MRSPFVFILLFFCYSCNKKPSVLDNTRANNDNLSKVKGYYIKAQKNKNNLPEAIAYLDSAIVISKESKIDSLHLKYLGYKSYIYSKNKEYNIALSYSDSLLIEAKRLKDTFYLAKAYFKKGLYNNKKNNIKEAFYNYTLSKKYFQSINDSLQVGNKLKNMATIQKDIGDYGASKETAIEGLKFLSNNDNERFSVGLYNVLAIIKKEEKEFDKSIEYRDKAFALLVKNNDVLSNKDSLSLAKLLNNKAVVYIKKGSYTNALKLLNRALIFPVIKSNSNLAQKALILDNIGVVRGKLQEEGAKGILLEAYRIRDSLKNKSGLNASYIHLCEFYIDKKEFDKALPWAELAYTNAQELKSLVAQKEALHYITKLERAPKPNYIKAYKKVTDSLTLLSNQVRKIYAEEKYEAHEYKLKALKGEKDANEAQFQKNISLIIGFALIILLLLYNYYSDKVKKEKNKKEQLIAVYTTETRISKRVHDELANDVYCLMTQLQSNDRLTVICNKEGVMDSLEIIYNKSRDISRETNSIDTDNFIETLKNMLSAYNNSNTNVISKGLNEGFWNNISDQKKIIVYRVLQELMTNMKKHSEASFTVLGFSRTNTSIEINYTDNGVGMDSDKQKLKNGLKNAENRMESINGVFIFETSLNKGVKVKMHIKI